MIYHPWNVLTIILWLFNILHSLSGDNVILLITCTTQTVHLKYTTPLLAVTDGTVMTTATDDGTWSPCTVAGVYTEVQYYLSVRLSQANCQQANFTELVFNGFFNAGPLQSKTWLNFTVVLSDPTHSRQLNVAQPFNGSLSTPSGLTLFPPANITFTFPAGQHQPGCTQVLNETVFVNPNVYLVSTNSTYNDIIGFKNSTTAPLGI